MYTWYVFRPLFVSITTSLIDARTLAHSTCFDAAERRLRITVDDPISSRRLFFLALFLKLVTWYACFDLNQPMIHYQQLVSMAFNTQA